MHCTFLVKDVFVLGNISMVIWSDLDLQPDNGFQHYSLSVELQP